MLFSTREKKIINLIFQGKSSLEIALSLNISENTVKSYKYRIKHKIRKFGIANIIDLAKLPVLI
ncbi:MAG: helix-turn-helix transcriptional regulator [Chitinophagales bacterium]|nr:helix-turn-helix transcriptional regulator [Chitinophagales bacterium]